jgi:two-component system NarL family sensor kinase
LAEGLHDHAIQNLLSARLELEETAEDEPHPALGRAIVAIEETLRDLREAVFQLHPYVLEQAGLEAALRSVAQRSARHAGFDVQLDLRHPHRHQHDKILLAAARELLANAARHAAAETVVVRLADQNGSVTLEVNDDGRGFDPAQLPTRLAEGHIGLQSQRERVESLGGWMNITTAPGRGTSVQIRVPA